MQTLLDLGLTNALLAVILGLLVLAITRLWRNPYAARFLWMIVLIKFVTPPMIDIPFPHRGFTEIRSDVRDFSRGRFIGMPVDSNLPQTPPINADLTTSEKKSDSTHITNNAVVSAEHSFLNGRAILPVLVMSVWISGSLLWLIVSIYRIVRFDRMIRRNPFVDALLQNQINSFAHRLGLSRCPQGRLTKASIAPLIWFTRPQPLLVLPVGLLENLSEQQTATVLTHELFHLKQHDHLVRWFELVVIVLFWWHPVLWWAVRQLHHAEEECCDALVLETFPEKKQLYGETLFKAAEFLNRQPSFPAMATSLGQTHQLKRRLTMILENRAPLRISPLKQIALLIFAVVVLPLSARAFPDQDATAKTKAAGNELHWKLKTGETLRYTLKIEYDTTVAVITPSEKLDKKPDDHRTDSQQAVSQQIDMKWKITGIKPDGTTSISMRIPRFRLRRKSPHLNQSIEYDSKINKTDDEALRKVSQAVTKSEFQLSMDSRGKIKTITLPEKLLGTLKDIKQLNDKPFAFFSVLHAEQLERQLNSVLLSLPDKTVATGDVWYSEEQWPLGNALIISNIRYLYNGPSNEHLKKIDLETTINVQPLDDPEQFGKIVFKKGENKGNVLFDSKSGRIHESRYQQTFSTIDKPQITQPLTNEDADKVRIVQTLTTKTALLPIPKSR